MLLRLRIIGSNKLVDAGTEGGVPIYRLAMLMVVGLTVAELILSESVAAEETNVAPRVSQYTEILRNNPHPGARRSAAVQLGKAGSEAVTAVPDLIDALQDSGDIPAIAGAALVQIAGAVREAAKTESLPELQKAYDALAASNDPAVSKQADAMQREIAQLQRLQGLKFAERVTVFVTAHPYLAVLGAVYPLLIVVCLVLLWLRPLALLRINDALKPHTDVTLPSWAGGLKLPLRHVMLVGFFHHRRRVLNAWVEAHVTAAHERFERKDTVRERAVHVPLLVRVDQGTPTYLSPGDLRSAFVGRLARLLIRGEGGAGKTHLACQIARWAMADDRAERLCRHCMLPVLIEQELDVAAAEGHDPLREAIGRQLQELADEPEPIAPDLLERLLRERRVLVILDHLSEMSAATREKIRPDAPGFPINALIVTSRLEEELGGMDKTVITPLRIRGAQISIFVEAYLNRRGKRDLFDDPEYFDAIRRLSEMVGDRDVTALLAKLYAEQMIIAKKEGGGERDLPDSTPALMLGYLNELNRAIPEADRRDDWVVHRDAKALAWECLSETYRPRPARIEDVRVALAGNDAEARLRYMEERLRLIRNVPPAKDRVRFLLDPLAEYLAGLHVVDRYRADEEAWREFLARADAMPGGLEAIRGFLLAVRDCCLARECDITVPGFVPDELAERAGLDLDRLRQARLQDRIVRYIGQLQAPDPDDRRLAAEALRWIGPDAAPAVPALIKALEDLEVRREALGALGAIGPAAEPAVPALIKALEEPKVRGEAVAVLRAIGPVAVSALIQALKIPEVQQEAASALEAIGYEAVPALIQALRDPEVRSQANGILRAMGGVAISGLLNAELTDPDPGVQRAARMIIKRYHKLSKWR